jgi:predicted ATP-dependent protease
MLQELEPSCQETHDLCYVHNFVDPDRPRLISLPAGAGRRFRRMVDELAEFLRRNLWEALGADGVRARKAALDEAVGEQIKAIAGPFEEDLAAAGLALVTVPVGPIHHSVIFPMVNGKPVPPERFERLHKLGKIEDHDFEQFQEKRRSFEQRLEEVNASIQKIRRDYAEATQEIFQREARLILRGFVSRIEKAFPIEAVKQFLAELMEDVLERRLPPAEDDEDFTRPYRVNVLLEHTADGPCPIIVENTPSLTNLLGVIDREPGPTGLTRSDHTMIRAGSLLRAGGGYLILEARDILGEPGAWKVLLRTLRTRRLEIVPPELSFPWGGPPLKPEPIDLDVRVILLGDEQMFFALDALDPDFPHLFKVLADFDSVIPRDATGVEQYAGVLSRICRAENLLPLDRSAVAALAEHGARIAARAGKLTAQFGRVADVAREAAYLAGRENRPQVTGDDIREAVRRTKRRADLPSRRFRELLADGTICVHTRGAVVGQINGLAVLHAGPLISGFPARITATIGPGTAGVINIEREAALSGAIHTKGFYILGGLLRHLLQTDHPLAFDASVAFEQSYGGIDGDSASGAEICCLLSALTEVPVRQDLAMTGAIDQIGHILAVGAVNEKIEGFFDTCRDIGLTGTQGVIIPKANAGDLMLRHDVVEACAAGQFQVYAVAAVHQALELFTGVPAGERDERDTYPDGTLLGLAMARAHHYWLRAAAPTADKGSHRRRSGIEWTCRPRWPSQ